LESKLDTNNYAQIDGGLVELMVLFLEPDGGLTGVYKVTDMTVAAGGAARDSDLG